MINGKVRAKNVKDLHFVSMKNRKARAKNVKDQPFVNIIE
jgi:hypothetical protein